MNWDDVKVFLAIINSGSVRAAAVDLAISHSTVLRRLDSLEERLGVSLFMRLSSGYVLTKTGEELKQYADNMSTSAKEFENCARGFKDTRSQTICVTMPEPLATYYLARYFEEFRAEHPNINVELKFGYDRLDLERQEADIAIRFSKSPDDDLIGFPLINFREGFFATPQYLRDNDPYALNSTACWIGWRSGKAWRKKTPFPTLPIRWQMANITVQLAACRNGFGLAQLPCFVGDQVTDLVRVPNSGEIPGFDTWVLYHKDNRAKVAIKAFTDFVVTKIRGDAALFEGHG